MAQPRVLLDNQYLTTSLACQFLMSSFKGAIESSSSIGTLKYSKVVTRSTACLCKEGKRFCRGWPRGWDGKIRQIDHVNPLSEFIPPGLRGNAPPLFICQERGQKDSCFFEGELGRIPTSEIYFVFSLFDCEPILTASACFLLSLPLF